MVQVQSFKVPFLKICGFRFSSRKEVVRADRDTEVYLVFPVRGVQGAGGLC